jgi:dinuclear metal center YbgI/SA1388 family protein
MKIADLVAAMERIAPSHLAEPWDNVGLLLGAGAADLRGPVLLTIDLTEAVAHEALRRSCGAVIAYHPPLFDPVRRITDGNEFGRVAVALMGAGVAVYSPHTALDAAPGGMNDWLADGLIGPGDSGGGGDRRALRSAAVRPDTQEVKVVTFVPRDSADAVRNALATAGAGIIGHYEACSFAAPGRGTFLAGAGASPAVGEVGRFEEVEELRLEMVCSKRALPLALETLRRFHPYEEPAVDVYELLPRPTRAVGAGRRITLDHAAGIDELAARLKRHLGVSVVQIARATDRPVERIGVCPGAGGSLAPMALAEGCQLFVTGEMKHHELRAAVAQGLSVLLAGHTQTERPYLPVLAARLGRELPGVQAVVSEEDREPWVAV